MPSLAELIGAYDRGAPGSSSVDAQTARNLASLAQAGIPVTMEATQAGLTAVPNPPAPTVAEQAKVNLEEVIARYKALDEHERFLTGRGLSDYGLTLRDMINLSGQERQFSERGQEFELRRQDAERAQQARIAQAEETRRLRREMQEQNLEVRQQTVDIARQRAEDMRLMRERMEGEKLEGRQNKELQSFGAGVERAGIGEQSAVLSEIEDYLTNVPELANYLTGAKSYMPDLMVSDEIAKGRQAFQKLFNITLKNRSGAAVTNQELERLKAEFAAGAWKTPQQIKAGVASFRRILNNHYKALGAGYDPSVVKRFEQNLDASGGRPVLRKPLEGGSTPRGGKAGWGIRRIGE